MVPNDILSGLRSALHKDRWVQPEAEGIDVAVTRHGIILNGSTETLGAKRRAVILANMAGETAVIDCLRRRPAGSTGDNEIARQLCSRLEQEPVFRDYGIALMKGNRIDAYRQPNPTGYIIIVSVDEGAIRLTGSVGSLSHRRMAEVLCWWLEDCQFVDNELEVSPQQEDNDDEINDAVRLCLEKDPFIGSGQLHVYTAAAIVRIEGSLRGISQRSRVLHDVWSVAGVWDIDDLTQDSGI